MFAFQFTRPRGARPRRSCRRRPISCFNSRARVGRDVSLRPLRFADLFQFTRPRGARRGCSARLSGLQRFNSRARVGRDLVPLHPRLRLNVSIHAPAWGATVGAANQETTQGVSIHAPAWGATTMRMTHVMMSLFQFTRPRGARRRRASRSSSPRRFNSRARVGRDSGYYSILAGGGVRGIFREPPRRSVGRKCAGPSSSGNRVKIFEFQRAISFREPTWKNM